MSTRKVLFPLKSKLTLAFTNSLLGVRGFAYKIYLLYYSQESLCPLITDDTPITCVSQNIYSTADKTQFSNGSRVVSLHKIFFSFPVLLQYIWHISLYTFKVCVQHDGLTYTHCEMITTITSVNMHNLIWTQ